MPTPDADAHETGREGVTRSTSINRRLALCRLGLAATAAYAAPVLLSLNGAAAQDGGGGSGGGGWGGGGV